MKKLCFILALTLLFTLCACDKPPAPVTPTVPEAAASDAASDAPDETDPGYFPAFTGVDFDGESVDSEALFSGNKITLVNFWFSTCGPCINELASLSALNEELSERGGQVIAINVDTLSGDEDEIAYARSLLEDKGATHKNVIPDPDSDARMFALSVTVFPTTYIVDGKGKIVGEPIIGRIDHPGIEDIVASRIDEVLGEE